MSRANLGNSRRIHRQGVQGVGGQGVGQGRGQFETSTFNFRLASASKTPFGYEEEAMSFLQCVTPEEEETR